MNYEEWSKKVEDNGAELSNEYFNMQVGLPYSEQKIHKLEKKGEELSKYFLDHFKEPEEVYRSSVAGVAGGKTYKLLLTLQDIRKTDVKSEKHKFRNQPVTWTTWRQFVVSADDNTRQEVYDEFIRLVPKISPQIKEFFSTSKTIFEQHNLTPLQNYLLNHKTSYEKITNFLTKLRDGIKKKYLSDYTNEVQRMLGRPPKYYDDLYFMRNVIFNDLVGKFKGANPLECVKKTLMNLGLDPSKIHVDDADRPNKYPSPFCSSPRVPQDVRISYKAENPLNDTRSIYHEMGHAIHETHVDPKLPYHERYLYSMGLAETFSQFIESLVANKTYLVEELKLDPELAEEYVRRIKVMELMTVAFYTGNSLFNLKMWHENVPFEKLDELYAKEQKQSMNLQIPGAYWQLHHILPESLLYVPSYLLSQANVCEMLEKCQEIDGERWWNNKKAGKYIISLMKPGTKSPMSDFSNVKPEKLIKELIS